MRGARVAGICCLALRIVFHYDYRIGFSGRVCSWLVLLLVRPVGNVSLNGRALLLPLVRCATIRDPWRLALRIGPYSPLILWTDG